MRACRLVVDTGMHALGWSRQQAIDYMTDNSPMRVGQIVRRDRPLRGHARPGARLHDRPARDPADAPRGRGGPRRRGSTIKGFHDTVLGSGLMPLPVLDRVVRDWVDGQRAPSRHERRPCDAGRRRREPDRHPDVRPAHDRRADRPARARTTGTRSRSASGRRRTSSGISARSRSGSRRSCALFLGEIAGHRPHGEPNPRRSTTTRRRCAGTGRSMAS